MSDCSQSTVPMSTHHRLEPWPRTLMADGSGRRGKEEKRERDRERQMRQIWESTDSPFWWSGVRLRRPHCATHSDEIRVVRVDVSEFYLDQVSEHLGRWFQVSAKYPCDSGLQPRPEFRLIAISIMTTHTTNEKIAKTIPRQNSTRCSSNY